MPPKSDLSEIIGRLQKLERDIGDVSDIQEAVSRARADLDSVNQNLRQAKAQMLEVQSNLTQAQQEAKRRFDQDMFNKQGSLRDLTERIKILEDKAKELTDEVSTKASQLHAINVSLDDARRRLTA